MENINGVIYYKFRRDSPVYKYGMEKVRVKDPQKIKCKKCSSLLSDLKKGERWIQIDDYRFWCHKCANELS